VNKLIDKNGLSSSEKEKVIDSLKAIDSILGVLRFDMAKEDQECTALISQREKARDNKDWATADRLREELKQKGIEIVDTRGGAMWRKI